MKRLTHLLKFLPLLLLAQATPTVIDVSSITLSDGYVNVGERQVGTYKVVEAAAANSELEAIMRSPDPPYAAILVSANEGGEEDVAHAYITTTVFVQANGCVTLAPVCLVALDTITFQNVTGVFYGGVETECGEATKVGEGVTVVKVNDCPQVVVKDYGAWKIEIKKGEGKWQTSKPQSQSSSNNVSVWKKALILSLLLLSFLAISFPTTLQNVFWQARERLSSSLRKWG